MGPINNTCVGSWNCCRQIWYKPFLKPMLIMLHYVIWRDLATVSQIVIIPHINTDMDTDDTWRAILIYHMTFVFFSCRHVLCQPSLSSSIRGYDSDHVPSLIIFSRRLTWHISRSSNFSTFDRYCWGIMYGHLASGRCAERSRYHSVCDTLWTNKPHGCP